MSEYLRDFINENVSIDCGGNKGLTSPESIQDKINEILNRLDRLEAGLGMTITLQDQLALTFFELENVADRRVVPAIPMPEAGTITRVTYIGFIGDGVSRPNIKVGLQFRRSRGGSEEHWDIEVPMMAGAYSATLSAPVLGNDYFYFSNVILPSGVLGYTIMPCHAYLQLPARTYQVER